MDVWSLDVIPRRGGFEVLLVDENGEVRRRFLKTTFVGYILPKDVSASKLVDLILQHPLVSDAYAETWLMPPWYDEKVEVVKFFTERYGSIRLIQRRAAELGLGEPVNTYPSPITQVLVRNRLNPCSRTDFSRLVTVEDLENPFYQPPPYRVSELVVIKWEGVGSGKRPLKLRIVSTFLREELRTDNAEGLREALRNTHILLYGGPLKPLIKNFPEILDVPVIINPEAALTGINGLVEWCRLSWIPLRLLSSASIGKVLTTIEGIEALSRRYLVPERVARTEEFRPLRELIKVDRGGFVMTPKPRIYFNVAQLDFNSLYPSIIVKYNVSPETVNRPKCRNRIKVPEAGHEICMDKEGLIPSVLSQLLKRRKALKEALHRSPPALRKVLDERQKAIKWVLVASFGYLGYRNARFGKIEAYESVTAFAREILRRAIEITYAEGFDVLHVIVDSIFASRDNALEEDYLRLARRIEKEVGIGIKIEGLYDWVAFPRTSKGRGAPGRYFGRLVNGEVKIKGMEAVSRGVPLIVKETQHECIKILATARGKEDLRKAFGLALKYVEHMITQTLKGKVPLEELVIERRLRRRKYRSKQPHVVAANVGRIREGKVTYIMAPIPYPFFLGNHGYSRTYYVNRLKRVYMELAELYRGLEK